MTDRETDHALMRHVAMQHDPAFAIRVDFTRAKTDALVVEIARAIEAFVTVGGGTYDELEALVERAVEQCLSRHGSPAGG